MGCELSKLAASEMHQDPIDRPPPPADPRSPLTAKQQYCMLASWKGIFRQIEKTGIILFVKLFEENEDLLHLFEKFSHLKTHEEQFHSEELAEHATKVMHTLDEGIRGLNDVDAFFTYVRHVGATHHQVPGFKAEYFWLPIFWRCCKHHNHVRVIYLPNSTEIAGAHMYLNKIWTMGKKIEQPFLRAAKTTLGDRYTPNIENIYTLTIRFILENLVKGYEDSRENGNGQT